MYTSDVYMKSDIKQAFHYHVIQINGFVISYNFEIWYENIYYCFFL